MTAPADPPSGDHTPGFKPSDGMPAVSPEERLLTAEQTLAEWPARPSGRRSGLMPETLDMLTAEARYHRQRYDLYRAKMYGPRPTSESRLRELQRWCESAERRLAAAKAARPTQPAEPAE